MKIESRAAAIPGLHLSGHGYQGMAALLGRPKKLSPSFCGTLFPLFSGPICGNRPESLDLYSRVELGKNEPQILAIQLDPSLDWSGGSRIVL